jgi:predicted RNA-binding Zn ribbon-like protein
LTWGPADRGVGGGHAQRRRLGLQGWQAAAFWLATNVVQLTPFAWFMLWTDSLFARPLGQDRLWRRGLAVPDVLARGGVTCQGGDVEFLFVGDSIALDFAATLALRSTRRTEMLRTGDDLATWAVQAGLVRQLPTVSPADLAQAKMLREAVYGLARAALDDHAPRPTDVRVINDTAAVAPLVPHLDAIGASSVRGGVRALLSTVARAGIEVVGGPDRRLLRRCGTADCTRLFVDRSRGGTRRWCDMATCGNQAKAAAYRRRRRARRTDPLLRP